MFELLLFQLFGSPKFPFVERKNKPSTTPNLNQWDTQKHLPSKVNKPGASVGKNGENILKTFGKALCKKREGCTLYNARGYVCVYHSRPVSNIITGSSPAAVAESIAFHL